MNTRKERFKRIATARTNKVMDNLRLLGNCANTSNYEYTDEEVRKIFRAVDKAVSEMKSQFSTSDKQDKNKFKL